MFHGAPPRCTINPPPHRPHRSDAATTQILSGLGPGGPVIYVSGLAGPGAKERLVRRLLASLPGRETDFASQPELWPLSLGKTALGQPHLMLGGRPGPSISFSQAAGCLWAALTPAGQVGVDAALPSEFGGATHGPEPSDPQSLPGPGPWPAAIAPAPQPCSGP